MKYNSLLVAATSQHVGKTTSTLGLASAIKKRAIDVGYCKPVGQRFITHNGMNLDKDVVLFSDLLHFDPLPALHSPVILGPGATTDFLDNPQNYNFKKDILFASKSLKKERELVIFEGTGHPGVGSVCEMNNADVAKLVKAPVIMVAEGGVGSTIDELALCIQLFESRKVPILGVILNKVIESKKEKAVKYVSKWLDKRGIPFLGALPFDKKMGLPIMSVIMDSVKGKIQYNPQNMMNPIEGFIAGSLITAEELVTKGNNLLLVVGANRLDLAIRDIVKIMKSENWASPHLAGIIATGEGDYEKETIDFVKEFQIPLVHTNFETYGAVVKISRIEVKINQQTPWKVERAIKMIEENIDIDYILEQLK